MCVVYRSVQRCRSSTYELQVRRSPDSLLKTVDIETRRPCCRREPPRDAGHLYRKIVPYPWATQWIERTLKLSANIEKLSINHFTSVSVKDWCMLPHGVTRPSGQSSRNSRNKFRLARPPMLPNFVALWKKVCDIRCGVFLSPKVGQSSR